MSDIRSISLLGVRIHSISVPDLIQRMSTAIDTAQRLIVANVNVHAMNIAYEQDRFREFLNRQAGIVFCDGNGVRLGAKLTGNQIDYRYTPPDWINDLCSQCEAQGYSIYLLGARQEVVSKAAATLQEQHPKLKIAGTQHGYFDKSVDHPENKAVVEKINQANPDILIVAFGMPLQEYWIMENWDALNAKIALPVGALFDYIAGEVYRAPRWITDNGFEWLARLVIEPRRLWRRYIIGNPLFIYRVIKSRFGVTLARQSHT